MPTILSFVNLKGGVGKTALSVNFSYYCASKGLKTLLIDTDPQTNATFSCITVKAWQTHCAKHGTIANLMGMRRHSSANAINTDVSDVIISQVFPNVDLIPSHLDLFTIDLDLAGATARESKLKRSLNEVIDDYDLIVCDCPPNLTIPTQNALCLSTHFAVPVSPDFLSALGIGILLKRVKEFCEDMSHTLEPVGIILSKVGRPANHRSAITDDIRTKFGDLVIQAEIKERVVVSEAASKNKPIFELTDQPAITEFTNCFNELLERMEIEI